MSLTISKLTEQKQATKEMTFLVRGEDGIEHRYSFGSLIEDLLQNPIDTFCLGSNDHKFKDIIFDGNLSLSDLSLNTLNVNDVATINTLQSKGKILLNEDSSIESSSSENLKINSDGNVNVSSLEAEGSVGNDIRIISATKFKVDKNMTQKEAYKLFEQKGITPGRYEGGEKLNNTFKNNKYLGCDATVLQPPSFTCLDYDVSKVGYSMPISFVTQTIDTQEINGIEDSTTTIDGSTVEIKTPTYTNVAMHVSPFGFIYQMWPVSPKYYLLMLGQIQTLTDVCNDPNFNTTDFNKKPRAFPEIKVNEHTGDITQLGVTYDGFYLLSYDNLKKFYTEEKATVRNIYGPEICIEEDWPSWEVLSTVDWSDWYSQPNSRLTSTYTNLANYREKVLLKYRDKYLKKQNAILEDFDWNSFSIETGKFAVDGVLNTTTPLKTSVPKPMIVSFYDEDNDKYYLLIDAIDEDGNYKVHVYSFREGNTGYNKIPEVQYEGDIEAYDSSLSSGEISSATKYSITCLSQRPFFPRTNIHKIDGKYQMVFVTGTTAADANCCLFESTNMLHWYKKIDFGFTPEGKLPALNLSGTFYSNITINDHTYTSAKVTSHLDWIQDAIFIPSSELSNNSFDFVEELSEENKLIGVQALVLVKTSKKLSCSGTQTSGSTTEDESYQTIQRLYVLDIPLSRRNNKGVYVADSSESNPQNMESSNWHQCGVVSQKEYMNTLDWELAREGELPRFNYTIPLLETDGLTTMGYSWGYYNENELQDKNKTIFSSNNNKFSNLTYINTTGEIFYIANSAPYLIHPSEKIESLIIDDGGNDTRKSHYLYKSTDISHFIDIDILQKPGETPEASERYIYRKVTNLTRTLQDSLDIFCTQYPYSGNVAAKYLGSLTAGAYYHNMVEGINVSSARTSTQGEYENTKANIPSLIPFNLSLETSIFEGAHWDPSENAVLFYMDTMNERYSYSCLSIYYYPSNNKFIMEGKPIFRGASSIMSLIQSGSDNQVDYIDTLSANPQNFLYGNASYPLLNKKYKAFIPFNAGSIYLKGNFDSIDITVDNPSFTKLYKSIIDTYSSVIDTENDITYHVSTSYNDLYAVYPLIACKVYESLRYDPNSRLDLYSRIFPGDTRYTRRSYVGSIVECVMGAGPTDDRWGNMHIGGGVNFVNGNIDADDPGSSVGLIMNIGAGGFYPNEILAPEEPVIQIGSDTLTFSNLFPIIDARTIIVKKEGDNLNLYLPYSMEESIPYESSFSFTKRAISSRGIIGGTGELLSSLEMIPHPNADAKNCRGCAAMVVKKEVRTKELKPFLTINKYSEQPIGATFYWNFPAQIVAKDINSKILLSNTLCKYLYM